MNRTIDRAVTPVTTPELRSIVAAPEVGQFGRVRDRHWVVSDVGASTFGADHLSTSWSLPPWGTTASATR
jgi:hypothetical protein